MASKAEEDEEKTVEIVEATDTKSPLETQDSRSITLELGDIVEIVQLQHVGEEGPHAADDTRRRQHAIDLPLQPAPVQIPVLGSRKQRLVRGRVPQQEAEPRGLGILGQADAAGMIRVGLSLIDDEQELRRLQHRRQAGCQPVIEVAGFFSRGLRQCGRDLDFDRG